MENSGNVWEGTHQSALLMLSFFQQKSLPNVPEDVNLDELIANVQLLEEEDSRRGGDK